MEYNHDAFSSIRPTTLAINAATSRQHSDHERAVFRSHPDPALLKPLYFVPAYGVWYVLQLQPLSCSPLHVSPSILPIEFLLTTLQTLP
jgi:hypothetical protein